MSKPIYLTPASELLTRILRGTGAADKHMEQYFREHREMGVRDRGAVAEIVYACLRQHRVLAHFAGGEEAGEQAIVAAHLLAQGASARALSSVGFRGDAAAIAGRERTTDVSTLPFAVRANLPDWLAEQLIAQYGEPETMAIAHSLNRPAPVDLRINSIKTDRDALQHRLTAEGFDSEATPYSPVGLRRTDRAPLFATGCFKEGLFEIQDEGSQLVSLLLEPRHREMTVDFCAGAGGKTLHLGALMANTGTLYAFDTSAKRLARLKERLKRSGLQNVRTVAIGHEGDERVRRLEGKVDRVLVDAPCSGTGTLRRNPDIKWRPFDQDAMTATQTAILAAAAHLVKPGGRLVYATCSILHAENDAIVAGFLGRHPEFSRLPVNAILERRRIPLTMPDEALRLFPHKHGTDGFYAAVLARR